MVGGIEISKNASSEQRVPPLTHKKANEGEIPQSYIHNNHEAIISEETFDRVQRELSKRTTGKNRISSVSIFSSRIKCDCCGGWYGSKVWHSNSKHKKKIWQCNHKFKRKDKCQTPHFYEDELKELFIQAVNQLLKQKKFILKEHQTLIETILDTTTLEEEQSKLETEVKVVTDLINECIEENTRKIQNQDEYQTKYNTLVEQYEEAKSRLDKVMSMILDKQSRKDAIQQFTKTIKSTEYIETFDEELWCSLVDEILITKEGRKTVQFKDGSKIEL